MNDEEVPQSDLPDDASPQSAPISGAPVPDEDIPSQSGQEVASSDLPDELNPSSDQKVETGFEGYMRGASAGVSDALAKGMRSGASALGVSPENLHYIAPDPTEMEARKEANPTTAGVSEFLGNATALSKILPEMGSKAATGMVQMMAMSGGDELSKAMLGQGDPADAVVKHIAQDGIMGLIGGKLFGMAEEKGLKALENSKLGNKMNSFISGIGHAASFPGEGISSVAGLNNAELEHLSDPLFKAGQQLYRNSGRIVAAGIGADIGSGKGDDWKSKALLGLSGAGGAGYGEKLIERAFGSYASALGKKYLAPTIMKIAASGPVENIMSVIDNNIAQSKGYQKIEKGIQGLFSSASDKALDYEFSDSKRNTLRKYIYNGGPLNETKDAEAKGYAEGGPVQPRENSLALVYPEQNTLLNATKMRVSNYLNSKRPLPPIKLPYDSNHEDPVKERDYNKTLDLAMEPLSILKHIKNGSLVPRQVKDFTGMYPELHDHLSKKITEEMGKQELGGAKKPSYKTRQAMSLFLGTSLDSTLTPQGIMAAQATFIQQKDQNAGDAKAKALNETAKNSQTPEQSREQRLNKN